MPVENSWLIKDRVMLTRLIGHVTVEDMVRNAREGTAMIESGIAPVYSLVDASGIEQFPLRLNEMKSISEQGSSDKLGWIVIYGIPNRFMIIIQPDTTRLVRVEEGCKSFHTLENMERICYTISVKLTAMIKLLPNAEQRQYLYQTLERANNACNWISEQAWEQQTFNNVRLHHLVYKTIRTQFDLGSQIAVRCVGKVAEAYKKDKQTKRLFKKFGSIPYDSHNLTFKTDKRQVTLWTLGGRLTINFVCGERQFALLQYQQGESDLVYRKGEFYLFSTCEVPDDTPIDVEGFLGVDLGVKNIAVDSDGHIHSAKRLLNVRHRHRRLRKKLQKKGTKAAKRLLQHLSGKEQRFARDVNHCISKQLVNIAKGTQRGIALENLEGIRDRVNVPRKRRNELHNWSFHQLRAFVAYKAQRLGVPVVYVDPRNTSRTCIACGCVDKRNRPNQAKFCCIACGFVSHADYVASVNIGRRGAVNHPHVGGRPG